MKIAIFENQISDVDGAFEAINLEYFNGEIVFNYFVSSQEIGDLNKILEYDLTLVDLSLALRSELDGYHLIKELIKIKKHPKIIILTGAEESIVRKRLKELELPDFPIIKKPVHLDDIYEKLSMSL